MDVTEGEVDDNLMVTEGSPVKTPSKRKSESDLQAGENKKRRVGGTFDCQVIGFIERL